MENNYTNLLEGNKPVAGQALYQCRLCFKEFVYYRDFALHEGMHPLHERMHLDQMSLTSGLQGGVRHTYDNRPAMYNTSMSSTTLESFEKLIQPFRGDAELRAHPSSPGSEPDKTAQVYRSEADNRSVPLDSRSVPVDTRGITMDSRNVAMETRPLSVDSRSMPVDSRNLQSFDARSLQLDSRSMPYSTSSYLDPLSRGLYSADLSKTQTATPTTFSAQPPMRPEDYFSVENRNQVLPKMDSQIYSKPDPYYGLSKAHYAHLGGSDKAASDNYAAAQYNLSKLMQPAYYPQAIGGQSQGMDKISAPSPVYYNQPMASPLGVKQDKKLPSPKQTLYYGQPPHSQPITHTTNTGYQVGITRPGSQLSSPIPREIMSPVPREMLGKLPEKPDFGRPYQTGHVSPHIPYTDLYKVSQSQTQGFSSVPTQPLQTQMDYSPYKLSSEPIPTVNIEFKPQRLVPPTEFTCYICYSPFANMNELSEHMKIHARAEISMENTGHVTIPTPQPPVAKPDFNIDTITNLATSIANSSPSNQHINSMSTSAVPYKTTESLTCQICTKAFLRPSYLAEHMKLHAVEQKYECKVCKKVFLKKSKWSRHEALHQRDILLHYCEICKESFKYKGNYLFHVQQKHTNVQAGKLVHIDNDADHEMENFVDCQVCDEEVEKSKLVEHLQTHPAHMCDKCERVFVQKTEYVEHLMSSHWQELADSSDNKSGSENSDTEAAVVDQSKRLINVSDSKIGADKEMVKEKKVKEKKVKKLKEGNNEEKKEKVVNESEKTEVSISRKEQIKNFKEKKKEVMKNLKEKQKEILNLENEKKKKESKTPKEKEMKNLKEMKKGEKVMDEQSKETKDSEMIIKDTKLKFSCSKCEQSFTKKGDLTLHVETHIKDPLRIYCEICDLSWLIKDKGYYIYHMKYHTDSELENSKQPPQLTCNVCYTVLPREKLVSHVNNLHTKYPCDICQWSYSSDKSMLKHIKSIHGNKKYKEFLLKQKEDEKIVEQKPPPVVYRKLKDLKAEEKANITKKPAKVFTCMICIKTFGKKVQFEKHLKIHNLKIEEQQIMCEICSAPFTSRGTYLYHIQQDHNKSTNMESQANQQNIQENKIISQKKIDEIESVDEKVVMGDQKLKGGFEQGMIKPDNTSDKVNIIKGTVFFKTESNEQIKNLEKSNEIKSESSQENVSEIVKNEAVCKDEKMKIEEMKIESPAGKQTVITVLNPVTGDFEEKVVEEKEEPETMNVFENFVEVDTIEEADTNEEEKEPETIIEPKKATDVVSEIMYCKLCNKCLKKNVAFEHMKVHCIYNCHACQYAFTKKKTFLHHRKLLHFEDIINEEIEQIENLDKFKKTEEAEKMGEQKAAESNKRKRAEVVKLVTCPLCTGEFKQDRYIDHVRSHAKLKLSCQFCDRKFSKKINLVIHEKSHERMSHVKNELPYLRNCPICDCSIISRENYVIHISEHVKKKLSKCKTCNETFTNDKNLDNHVKVYHDSNIRVIWKLDGEGMKFDVKTGRIGEVLSDYMCEIKEINELLKLNDKAEIWMSSTPKKSKEKVVNTGNTVNKSQDVKVVEEETAKNGDDDEDDEEEKIKTDTSDEEYVPEESDDLLSKRSSRRKSVSNEDDDVEDSDKPRKRRPGRKKSVSDEENDVSTRPRRRRSGRRKSVSDEVDDDDKDENKPKRRRSGRRKSVSDEVDDDDKDENKPKRRRSRRSRPAIDENEDNDEEDEVDDEKEEDEEYRPSIKKTRKSLYASDDDMSSDNEKYTPKGTRTRKAPDTNTKLKVNQKSSKSKERPSRVPTTTPEKSDSTNKGVKRKVVEEPSKTRSNSLKKVKTSDESSSEDKDKYKLKPGEPFPRKCPICRKPQESRRNYTEHMTLHSGEKPFKCPVCESSYSRERNMKSHILAHHKNYRFKATKENSSKDDRDDDFDENEETNVKTPVTGKLRTRARNLNSKLGEPASTSTPIKSSRLVVKLSPLDLDKALSKVNKSTDVENVSLDSPNKSYVCEFCNKKMGHNQWNYKQHIARHKKEMKKKGKESKPVISKKEIKKKEESKPFSCKDCSESFKKKRDLYIHAKVHSNEPMDEDVSYSTKTDQESAENGELSQSSLTITSVDNTVTTECDTSENIDSKADDVENTCASENNKENNDSLNTNSTSLNDSLGVSAGMDLGDSFSIDQETYKIVVSERKSGDESETGSSNESVLTGDDEQSQTKTKKRNNLKKRKSESERGSKNKEAESDSKSGDSVVSTSSRRKSQNSNADTSKAKESNKSNGAATSLSSERTKMNKETLKTNAAETVGSSILDTDNDSLTGNNNDENKKADDSESDDKSKQSRAPATVTKMSSETALSKWKTKVKATLSSQLELHATKQLDEMANPEIAKVKEYLSISGKPEKRKLECRICGPTFDLESSFRDHMDVHLNESPPYCSICDIYFMAIYPKRRLMEHYRKKHPELQT